MSYSWGIIGHQAILRELETSMSHAYIFAGPEHVGKFTTAQRFAQRILCQRQSLCGTCASCKVLVAGHHPDLEVHSTDGNITVETVRGLLQKVALKPFWGDAKVVIIDNAERITTEAANALLKNLEEPRGNTVFILVTAHPQTLPATVRSRCRFVRFSLLPRTEIALWLKKENVTAKQADVLQSYGFGRPGLIIAMRNDRTLVEKAQHERQGCAAFFKQDVVARFTFAKQIADDEVLDVEDRLRAWIELLHDYLLRSLDLGEFTYTGPSAAIPEPRLSTAQVVQTIRSLNQAQRLLAQNTNKRLTLENSFLTIPTLL